MQKFNIISKFFKSGDKEAKNANEALVNFAAEMDTDMNNYFKAIPAADNEIEDVVVDDICKLLRSMELSAESCTKIFRTISSQSEVIGGKFWTTYDIEKQVRSHLGELGDDVVEELTANVCNIIDQDVFDDTDDSEWNAINSVIEKEKIIISDIHWDVDREDFDNEAEYRAVVENELPEATTISIADLNDISIEDYLSDEYGYCVRNFTVKA